MMLALCMVSCSQITNTGGASDSLSETDNSVSDTDKKEESMSDTTQTTEETEYIPSRTVKIACVGDSITYGVGASNAETKSYPVQLEVKLGVKYEVKNFSRPRAFMIDKRDYPDFTYSSEYSIAYKNTEQYQQSLQYDADIVFICLGANDAHASDKNTSIDQAKYYYDSAVALAKEYQNLPSKPTVYFIYPPSRFDAQYRYDYVKNTIIPQMDKAAKATGCETIDMFSVTDSYAKSKNTNYINKDGVHLADGGYTLMASTVLEAVKQFRLK